MGAWGALKLKFANHSPKTSPQGTFGTGRLHSELWDWGVKGSWRILFLINKTPIIRVLRFKLYSKVWFLDFSSMKRFMFGPSISDNFVTLRFNIQFSSRCFPQNIDPGLQFNDIWHHDQIFELFQIDLRPRAARVKSMIRIVGHRKIPVRKVFKKKITTQTS